MPNDFRLNSNYSLTLPEFDRTLERNKQNIPLVTIKYIIKFQDEDKEYQKHIEPFK